MPRAVLGLDLVTLRVFKAAVEERSLARASERERLAVSAISRRLTDFEARLGVALLRRHERGVEPTAAGKALLHYLDPLFDLLDQAFTEIEAFATGACGRVRLFANAPSISGFLPELLAEFLAGHPNIEVSVAERFSVDIVHAVRTDAADLGLVSGTVEAPDLQLIPWKQDRLVVLLPTGHRLAAREGPIRFAELAEEPFIGMASSIAQERNRREAQLCGIVLHERASVESFDSVCRMVEAGLGVAVLPEAGVRPFVEKLAVRNLDEPWAGRSLALCARRRPESLSAATRMLAAHLLGRALSSAPSLPGIKTTGTSLDLAVGETSRGCRGRVRTDLVPQHSAEAIAQAHSTEPT